MTLSLNLILPLLILMPGLFVAYRASFHIGSVIHRPLLSTSSIAALVLIPYMSCVAHLSFAVLFAMQSLICDYGSCFPVPFEPNPYQTAYKTITKMPVAAQDAWIVGFWAVILPYMTYLFWYVRHQVQTRRAQQRYGADRRWPGETRIEFLDRLQSTSDDASLIAEIVLRDALPNGTRRYIGMVDEIRLNGDDTIASITLLGPEEIQTGTDYITATALYTSDPQMPLKLHGEALIGSHFYIIDQSDVEDYDMNALAVEARIC